MGGPAHFAAGHYLVWSDIPNNRIMCWDETDGSVSVFCEPSNNSNGHTVDAQGRLISSEHLTRRVTRTEFDGSIEVLADRCDSKRLNSPNDVVVKSDGFVWFTDPSYGILMDYEGECAESEIGACHVYRYDPDTLDIQAVATDSVKSNDHAFSPYERVLFVVETGVTDMLGGPAHIRRHKVKSGGRTLGPGDVFSDCSVGLYVGFDLTEMAGSGPLRWMAFIVLIRKGILLAKLRFLKLCLMFVSGAPNLIDYSLPRQLRITLFSLTLMGLIDQ